MAERRMFAKSIVLSDAFLDMSMSARLLYFTFGMLADDDGFIGNCKAIMRQCGASMDDMALLLDKKFVIDCGDGIIVIKHWRMNNYLQKDRYKETPYTDKKELLTINENGSYTKCIQNVYTGKDSIDKYSIGNNSSSYSSDDNNSNEYPSIVDQVYNRYKEAGYANNLLDEIENYLLKKVKYEHYESAFQEMLDILQNKTIIKKLDYAYVRLQKLGYLREEKNNENI